MIKTITYNPETHVLVPREPSEEMLQAALRANMQHVIDCINDPTKSKDIGSEETCKQTYRSRYASMITAAPQPEQVDVGSVGWKHDCAALCANDIELWIDRCPHCGKPRHNHPPTDDELLNKAEQVESEPVGWYDGETGWLGKRKGGEHWQPVFTHQPADNKTVDVEPVAMLPFAILDDELADLRRFTDCADDGEGYDVPKNRMKRLAEIGLLRHVSAGYYEHTVFGLSVLNGDFTPTRPDRTVELEAALSKFKDALFDVLIQDMSRDKALAKINEVLHD